MNLENVMDVEKDACGLSGLTEVLGATGTGVGEWCAPGPATEQHRRWMLVFDDADRGTLVFDDETEARLMFHRAEGGGWNCHLFQTAPRVVPNAALTGAEGVRVEGTVIRKE